MLSSRKTLLKRTHCCCSMVLYINDGTEHYSKFESYFQKFFEKICTNCSKYIRYLEKSINLGRGRCICISNDFSFRLVTSLVMYAAGSGRIMEAHTVKNWKIH